jgi:hypothetical protein
MSNAKRTVPAALGDGLLLKVLKMLKKVNYRYRKPTSETGP